MPHKMRVLLITAAIILLITAGTTCAGLFLLLLFDVNLMITYPLASLLAASVLVYGGEGKEND